MPVRYAVCETSYDLNEKTYYLIFSYNSRDILRDNAKIVSPKVPRGFPADAPEIPREFTRKASITPKQMEFSPVRQAVCATSFGKTASKTRYLAFGTINTTFYEITPRIDSQKVRIGFAFDSHWIHLGFTRRPGS